METLFVWIGCNMIATNNAFFRSIFFNNCKKREQFKATQKANLL
jgi:hypothetical protein